MSLERLLFTNPRSISQKAPIVHGNRNRDRLFKKMKITKMSKIPGKCYILSSKWPLNMSFFGALSIADDEFDNTHKNVNIFRQLAPFTVFIYAVEQVLYCVS